MIKTLKSITVGETGFANGGPLYLTDNDRIEMQLKMREYGSSVPALEALKEILKEPVK